jgi:hypothetical protein
VHINKLSYSAGRKEESENEKQKGKPRQREKQKKNKKSQKPEAKAKKRKFKNSDIQTLVSSFAHFGDGKRDGTSITEAET